MRSSDEADRGRQLKTHRQATDNLWWGGRPRFLSVFDTEIKFDAAAGMLQVAVTGRVAAADIFGLVEQCRSRHPAPRECWDFSGVELAFDAQEALRGARRLRTSGPPDGRCRVALVFGGEASEILCRTYAEFVRIERPATIMQVFATRAEALDWLLEKRPAQSAGLGVPLRSPKRGL